MKAALTLRMILRQARGARGRLAVLALCITVGVAALVAVSSLVEGVERGIRVRARELLGGDLALESRRPLPDARPYFPASIAPTRMRQVDMSVLSTMASNPAGASRLVEVKAVDTSRGQFPLAGKLELDPARPLSELLDDHSVLVAPELLATLSLRHGDSLRIGALDFRIAGSVQREPDPLTFSLSLGPRVLLTKRALESTGLLSFGSRVVHRSLFAFDPGLTDHELDELKLALERSVPGGGSFVSVETRNEAQPALRRTLERTRRYLGLVALLSLLVACVGVAQTVSTWLRETLPQVAALRCMGLTAWEIFGLHAGLVLLTATVGSLIGSLLGASVPMLVARLEPDLIPPALASFVPVESLLLGLALGIGVAVIFSLPALTAVWRVPPARVLRSEAAPLPAPRAVITGALLMVAAGLIAAAYLQTHELSLALGFTAAVSAFTGILWLAARGLLWAVARLPRERMGPYLRHGTAALSRPGAGSVAAMLALGLGTLVVSSITLLEDVLGREIHTALPTDAPSVFLVDIQPDQWPGLEALARERGARNVQSVPVVMARLSHVDGRTVDTLLKERGGNPNEKQRVHWVLTREQRISWVQELPADNKILEGRLWQDPDPHEVSLEAEFAKDLGAQLGSVLRFDVQGIPMDFKVTSLRSVVWRSFSMNFFMFTEPGALDDAPQIRLGGVRLAPAAEQPFQDEVAKRYPNVTVLKVQELLERAGGILEQVALAVRLLGGFAVLTGLLILVGTVAATHLRRAREAALLKALGLTRASVLKLLVIEYALLGSVAGLLGAAGAYALVSQVAYRVLEMDSAPSVPLTMISLGSTVVLATLGGLAASVRALLVPPLAVLRQES
ncbi:MAG: ABC transporter permease [Myxococcales bacterium]